MKNLLFAILIIFLASCGNDTEKVSVKDNTSSLESKATLETNTKELDFSNPSVFIGSDFGDYFRTLYKHGKFDDMIKFTSKESLDEFGEDVVRNFYENEMKFGYEIGKPQSSNSNGDYITLNYNGNIIATKTIIRIVVTVENDSCKIVLPSELENFPS